MAEQVECRSDWRYAQRPLAFTWQGTHYQVKEIVAEQRTPNGIDFLVRTNQAELFQLGYYKNSNQWNIQLHTCKEST